LAVRIRLTRKGKKKKPFYRVVVAENTSPRDGKTIDQLGQYDPTQDPALVNFNEDKVKKWLSEGAKPTETVKRLFQNAGFLPKPKQAKTNRYPGKTKKEVKEILSGEGSES
tara:strand:+ start:4422 stop:4754 length:333 start_codon:yes stop_codon:yes gene_type:complete